MHCMATTVYHEAAGQPQKVQRKVIDVVLNRARHEKSVCAAVKKKGQFSWYRSKGLMDPVLRNGIERAEWRAILKLVSTHKAPTTDYEYFKTCGRTICFKK